ncbi:MAG: pyocin knob domain-containing protein [Blastococcus sp.]
MPTTIKGIPYPADTVAPNVPSDLQALAENLDFSKVPLLTVAQIPGATTPMETYPLGVSVTSVSTAEAVNWPGQNAGHLWTYKTSTARCAQLYFANLTGPTLGAARVYYRQLQPSGGTATPWVLLAPWTTVVTLPDIAATGVQTFAVTFPVNMFTGTPVASAAPVGSSFLVAGLSGTPGPGGVTVYCRSTATGVVSGAKVHVIVEGGY